MLDRYWENQNEPQGEEEVGQEPPIPLLSAVWLGWVSLEDGGDGEEEGAAAGLPIPSRGHTPPCNMLMSQFTPVGQVEV